MFFLSLWPRRRIKTVSFEHSAILTCRIEEIFGLQNHLTNAAHGNMNRLEDTYKLSQSAPNKRVDSPLALKWVDN